MHKKNHRIFLLPFAALIVIFVALFCSLRRSSSTQSLDLRAERSVKGLPKSALHDPVVDDLDLNERHGENVLPGETFDEIRKRFQDVRNRPENIHALTLDSPVEGEYITQNVIDQLDLSGEEVHQINEVMENALTTIRAAEVENISMFKQSETETLAFLEAFPEVGAQIRDDFDQQLGNVLGDERKDLFGIMSKRFLNALTGDFGNHHRLLKVERMKDGLISVELRMINDNFHPDEALDLTNPDFFENHPWYLADSVGKLFPEAGEIPYGFRHLFEERVVDVDLSE